MRWIAPLAMAILSGPLHAAPHDAVARAARAAEWLDQATVALAEVDGADDHVAALTRTIGAFEDGLAALRAGLRDLEDEIAFAEDRLAAEDATLAALLGTLHAATRAPVANGLAHPHGPLGAARAAGLIANLAPAAAGRVATVRSDLDDLRALRSAAEDGLATLGEGRTELARARVSLIRQTEASGALDVSATDQAVLDLLAASAGSLADFADSLSAAVLAPTSPEAEWPLPVRGARTTDGDGWRLVTRPGALVTAPTTVSVRFAGPLLDLGQVAILEPAPGVLIVMTGLGQLVAASGTTLASGAAVGLMPDPQQNVIGSGAGQSDRPSLYLEIRQGNRPVDPDPWFTQEQTRG